MGVLASPRRHVSHNSSSSCAESDTNRLSTTRIRWCTTESDQSLRSLRISCNLLNHMCQYHRAQTPEIYIVLVRAFNRSNVHLSHSSHRIACTQTIGVRPLESMSVRVKASVRSRYPSIPDNSSITCTDIYHIRRATQKSIGVPVRASCDCHPSISHNSSIMLCSCYLSALSISKSMASQ
jgi:hypothetical protein